MRAVVIEIRDHATFIPALVVYVDPECESDRYLLSRAGYGLDCEQQRTYVLLVPLNGAPYDPYKHGPARTLQVAHEHLIAANDLGIQVKPGDVVDVEYVLGETHKRKRPERETP